MVTKHGKAFSYCIMEQSDIEHKEISTHIASSFLRKAPPSPLNTSHQYLHAFHPSSLIPFLFSLLALHVIMQRRLILSLVLSQAMFFGYQMLDKMVIASKASSLDTLGTEINMTEILLGTMLFALVTSKIPFNLIRG